MNRNKKYKKWMGIQKRLLVFSIASCWHLRNGGTEARSYYIIYVRVQKTLCKTGMILNTDKTNARQKLDAVFRRVI